MTPQPNLSGFWLAAFIRAALLLVPFGALVVVLVLPASSPLHGYSSLALGVLSVLVLWVVISTVRRYRYRLINPITPAEQPDGVVSLRR